MFSSLATQWRTNGHRLTGVDYSVIPVVMDLHNIKSEERQQVFTDIKVMETAALEQMQKKTQN